MLLVVTVRKHGEPVAHRHICDDRCTTAFCGTSVPEVVWTDSRSYIGKGPVTCIDCLSEHANGRTEGFRDAAPAAEESDAE
jgi:hypothetical protein